MLSMDAELAAAARSGDGVVRLQEMPASVLWLTGGLLAAALAVVAVGCAAVIGFLVLRYGARMLLRAAHARPVDAGEEPDLERVVENLCIGAGLPMPRLHLVESPSPNAFATGSDPQRASLVVTRGLLTLVDRRELQGVIAHELSHIGNEDTRLTALLAAVVGMTSLPWRIGLAPLRYAFKGSPAAGVLFTGFALSFGWIVLSGVWMSASYLMSEEVSAELPPFMWWWAAHAMLAPAYALFVAPVVALLIRQRISRQREFLADADAVSLTRDPEGLALALAKIGAAGDDRLRVGEGSVHLYIVDPRGTRSLLHRIFPSHPPLKDRIELLARMGSGIPKAALDAAIEAGRRSRLAVPVQAEPAKAAEPDQAAASPAVDSGRGAIRPQALAQQGSPPGPAIPLYERPDGWSKVLAELDENAALTLLGSDGGFIRVVTADNIRGYVSSSARLAALRNIADERARKRG
jgi:heat shock protein HtpX